MTGAWKHTELEAVLRGPVDLGAMTEETVRTLLDEYPNEGEFVDFKSAAVFDAAGSAKPGMRYEWGKDVAAMANGRGGILIFGVIDSRAAGSRGIALQDRVQPFENRDPADLIDQFNKAVRSTVAPAPAFDIAAVPIGDQASGNQFVLVCVIPPSVVAPHAVTSHREPDRAVHFPRRTAGDSHTDYLREHQIAGMYQQRARSDQDRRHRAASVWESGTAWLLESELTRVWIAVAVVPDLPQHDLLTPEVIAAIDEWDSAAPAQFPHLLLEAVDHGGWEMPLPAPGRMVFTGSARTTQASPIETPILRNSCREIHADGSAFAAIALTEEIPADSGVESADVSIDGLVDRVIAAAANTLSWTTARAGTWGSATVTAGLVISGRERIALKADGHGGARQTTARDVRRAVWTSPPPPPVVTVAELGDAVAMPGALRAAYRLALPMVQTFGISGLGWLTAEGGLTDRMPIPGGPSGVRAFHEWAQRHGVDAQ